jgi:hypothetical protein
VTTPHISDDGRQEVDREKDYKTECAHGSPIQHNAAEAEEVGNEYRGENDPRNHGRFHGICIMKLMLLA